MPLALEPPPDIAIAVEPGPAQTANALAAQGPLNRYPRRHYQPPIFVSAGYIGSFIWGDHPATAHGVEASLLAYLDSAPGETIALGPVVQYQSYSGPAHGRLGAGIGLAYPFCGLDVLYALRRETRDHATTHGLSLGPYLTFVGILHVAGRFTFALSPSDPSGAGNEYGLTLGVKLPLLISGDFFEFGSGRP